MSNSPLVNYTRISPNKTVMSNKKNTHIVIHHMAGNLTVEQCGSVFSSSSREASSNYGVDTKGRVGMYVEEKDRSWATSSREIDSKAVTIEVANDTIGGDWHVSDTALRKTIELCADICKRNGIPRLNYTGDKSGNLHAHRWYASTACPGPYLYSKFSYIADEVNKILGGGKAPTTPAPATKTTILLKRGSTGAEVRTLQTNLNKVINAKLVVDGDFGKATEAAVKSFQKKYNLDVDGIYGEESNKAMKKAISLKKTEKPKTTTTAKKEEEEEGFKVRITASALNVRREPNLNARVNTVIKRNEVYTIVDEKNGFGKLKSGAGWIMMKYTQKI